MDKREEGVVRGGPYFKSKLILVRVETKKYGGLSDVLVLFRNTFPQNSYR